MHNQAFEIKVALLGYVSVGKTTVLNALFQEQFSEVSRCRTTAAVNHFRVSSDVSNESKAKNSHTSSDGDDDVGGDNIKSSSQTLHQTTVDNNLLREQNLVQETTFDIKLDQDLFEMRHDTRLTVVDIPGINEAHTCAKYMEYVNESWDSFDCIVIVMDALQGVNTEEQVKLLQLVKINLTKFRDVPVIVLCNKVDDPDKKEIKELVNEVRAEVERVFDVGDREKALEHLLLTSETSDDKLRPKDATPPKLSPAFIPISAGNAFLYRAASRLSFDKFRLFNEDFVDEIGREEFGRFKWKRFSLDEKYEQIYNIVNDPTQYEERIAVSNFDKFLNVLNYFIGGENNQTNIIQAQMDLTLGKISSQCCISDEINKIFDCCEVLNKPTKHLEDRFWILYSECEADALNKLMYSPENICCVHKPMNELINFALGAHKKMCGLRCRDSCDNNNNGRTKDDGYVLETMKGLVRQVCSIAIEKACTPSSWKAVETTLQGEHAEHWDWNCKNGQWHNTKSGKTKGDKTRHPAGNLPNHWTWDESKTTWVHNVTNYSMKKGCKDINPAFAEVIANMSTKTNACTWTNLSPLDVRTILSSIYIMAHNKHFCKYFGREIAKIEWIRQIPSNQLEVLLFLTKGSYVGCKFVPNNTQLYNYAVHLEVPENIENHMHWGHIAWMYCEFMEYREGEKTS